MTRVSRGGDGRRAILIYRNDLLSWSETFVYAQAEALQLFRPHYVGTKLCHQLSLPADRTHLVHGGGALGFAEDYAFKLMGYVPRAAARLQSLDPALIHAHFGPDAIQAMPLARRFKVPLVVTFHGFDATMRDECARRSFLRHRVYIARRDKLMKSGALILAVSAFIKHCLLEQGFPAERIVVHYTGVDLGQFHGDAASERDSVVLFVGRLTAKKGAAHLVRAMGLLRERHPATKVVFVGDGPERDSLKRLAAELRVPAEFRGVLSVPAVADCMRRAAVFCGPSLTAADGSREAFGMVFAEAQACGLPVVSYAVGGVPEAVGDDIGGLLVREGDWHALASALDSVLANDRARRAYGHAGQKRTVTMFDLHKQTTLLEALYERELMSNDGR